MKVRFTARHFQASNDLQERVQNGVDRLARFYERITACHVVLDAGKKGRLFAEIKMGTRGKTLVAKANAENMGKAIDDVLLKIERQLKKQNQRKHEYRQNNSRSRIEQTDEEKEAVES